MKIYYQGHTGSYMHMASKAVEQNLSNVKVEGIVGLNDFKDVWENIQVDGIGVLAIENSYIGSIHTNLYNFLKYDYKVIGEYYLEINHCLCSKENDLENIK